MTNCINCGQQIDKAAIVCPFCGATQEERTILIDQTQQQYTQQSQYGQRPPKKPVNRKLIAIIAGVVVAALLVIFVLTTLLGPGSLSMEGAVNAYYEAMVEKDAEDYVDACYPPKFLKAYADDDLDRDDMLEYVEDMLEWYDIQDVKNIKITDKDNYSKSEVRDVNEGIENYTGVKVNFSEIVEVTVEYEYKEDGEWVYEEDYLTLYKSGTKWYVLGN